MATILVVDDERDARDLVGRILARAEHRVLAVSGAREAQEVLRVQGIDLVIADVMMPEMSGLELCRTVRAMPRNGRVPFVFLSCKETEGDRLAGLDAGGDDYVTKPCQPLDLITRVEAALQRQRRQADWLHRLEETEEGLEDAALVQRGFLPAALPHIEGVRVAACFQPMAAVGGDIYHVARTGDGRLAIFVADAMGHGVPAALVGTAARVALAACGDRCASGEVLARLNRVLHSLVGDGRFATAFYGVYDPAEGTISWAAAGHPRPLVVAGPRTRWLSGPGGLPLGIEEEVRYGTLRDRLLPGEALLLYTDGLTDRLHRDPIEAERLLFRFARRMTAKGPVDAGAIATRLGEMPCRRGGRQDDVTLVVLGRTLEGITYTD